MAKNIDCANCGAENPAGYTYCHCCRALPGTAPFAKAHGTPEKAAFEARQASKRVPKKTAKKSAAKK